MEYVVVRKLEHLTGSASAPALGYAVETRDRPGPVHKEGTSPGDDVWIQLHGGLVVGRATIELGWVGEYSRIDQVRDRTRAHGPLHGLESFWQGRPRYGYAAVAGLEHERWFEPFWAGPRTYGYEWVVLENEKKRSSWLDPKPPPRGGEQLLQAFRDWLAVR
ncbi:MAG: hypothetical protein ABR600_07290 [Actinomycetota bacterium]